MSKDWNGLPDRSAAASDAGARDGWMTVDAKGLMELCAALERAESKGYMPDAIADAWASFDFGYAAPAPAADSRAVAWEYRNQYGNPFLTHTDPTTWHPNDKAGFKDFRALGYVTAPPPASTNRLTDERIRRIWLIETGTTEQDSPLAILDFARAIIAATENQP